MSSGNVVVHITAPNTRKIYCHQFAPKHRFCNIVWCRKIIFWNFTLMAILTSQITKGCFRTQNQRIATGMEFSPVFSKVLYIQAVKRVLHTSVSYEPLFAALHAMSWTSRKASLQIILGSNEVAYSTMFFLGRSDSTQKTLTNYKYSIQAYEDKICNVSLRKWQSRLHRPWRDIPTKLGTHTKR
jgi:hypothetical protein